MTAGDRLHAVLTEDMISVEENRNDVRVEEENGHRVGFKSKPGAAGL